MGMALTGFAVRVLVILSLLCNGIGSAYAMATAHAPPPAAQDATASAHAGCHEDIGGQRDAGDHNPAPKRRCCGGDWCACPCTGLAAIHAPTGFPLMSTMPAMGELARATDSGHVSPRLSHLLRPPIG